MCAVGECNMNVVKCILILFTSNGSLLVGRRAESAWAKSDTQAARVPMPSSTNNANPTLTPTAYLDFIMCADEFQHKSKQNSGSLLHQSDAKTFDSCCARARSASPSKRNDITDLQTH
mgnify:CR=1 FL=1